MKTDCEIFAGGTLKHLRAPPPPQLGLNRQTAQTPYPDLQSFDDKNKEDELQGASSIHPLSPAYLPVSTKPITSASDLPGYLGPDLHTRYG